MKCEKCQKNEATVFYRENINGKEAKYHLCPKCASELEKEIREMKNPRDRFERTVPWVFIDFSSAE